MTALLLLACVPVVMWIAQSVLLAAHGLPIRWRLDAKGAPRRVRAAGRAITQLGLVAVTVVYPLLRGQSPVTYYAGLFPSDRAGADLTQGFAAAVVFLGFLYTACLASGGMVVEPHESRRRLTRHLLLLLPIALPGAVVEEMLFRGVVMADLAHDWPERPMLVVAGSTVVFAAAHYVRKVKRLWTFAGHVMLGLLLSVAFHQTGDLWLATGLHAGGNFMILGSRPLLTNKGPAWLTGASIFPYAGAAGVVGLGILTVFVAAHY